MLPLTDTGTKSADDLCDYFKEKQIKHVYVSRLNKNTANV